MAMSKWVGWGITTFLSYLLNNSDDDSDSDPAELSAEAAELGTPVPVIMGRSILKSPLVVYYGGFDSEPYTETYGAHSEFNAWPLVLTLIAEYISSPTSGHLVTTKTTTEVKTTVKTSGGSGTGEGSGTGTTTGTTKDDLIGPLLNSLFMWLLSWLINGHMLKTTIQKGFKYYLGYQMIACVSGEGVRLRGVYLNPDTNSKEVVWSGDISRESYPNGYTISIDDDELFGGPDESGGFIGDIRIYLGGNSQGTDSWMVEQMSADSVAEALRGLTPAYRAFVSLVVPVAYVGKQASIPTTWLDLQWIPNRLGLGGIGDNDVNPAEAIYEMIVNESWGLNRDPALIDVDSLIACGKVLAEEGIGVTIKLAGTSQVKVKEVIDNICDHVDMVRYIDPQTGKLTFKLIRDDYDAATLPVIDQSIAEEIEYTRVVWSSSKGEIIAKYSDCDSYYDTSTVMESDPAIIEANSGDRNSEEIDFTLFTNSTNAAWAANRELREKGYPLASAKLYCNRKVASYRQGDVFKLNWTPYGISNLIMRVSDIDLGDFNDGTITITAIEDVFGVGKTTYTGNDTTSWTKPDTYPTGVQLFRFFEMPWEILQTKDSYVYSVAVLPDEITKIWKLWRYRDLTWTQTTSMSKWTPAGQLVGAIAEDGDMEDVTGFEVIDINGDVLDMAGRKTESGMALARNGSRLLMINDELMAWGTITQLANGNFKISNIIRATYDTVPAAHAAGDTVYFLDYGYYSNVTTGGAVCAKGLTTTEKYNITTATAYAEEDFSNLKTTELTTVRRAERPTPPGRIRMTSHLNTDVSRLTKAAGNITFSWTNRNKSTANGCVSQEDLVDYYTGDTVATPIGLQTVIRAYLGSNLIHEETLLQTENEDYPLNPITSDSFTYTWTQRCLDSTDFSQDTILTITAKLDDLESYQYQSRTVEWKPPYIVDACATEDEAKTIIASIYSADGIALTFTDTSKNKSIPIKSMPLIILGTVNDIETTGAILSQAGKWVVPNGTALAITGADTYDTVTLANGYIALTYFDTDNPGDLFAYQFDGTLFNKIAVPAL